MGHSQCGAVIATLDELTGRALSSSRNLRFIVQRVRAAVEPLMAAHPDLDPETLRPRRRTAALKPVPIQRDFPRDQVAYFAERLVAEKMPLGPDPARHAAAIEEFAKAGFTHVWVHQVGPDQEGFFRFYQRQVLPQLRRAA